MNKEIVNSNQESNSFKEVEMKNYLTNKLTFIKPMSMIGELRLMEFKNGLESLEDLFESIGVKPTSLSYGANDWNTFVYFKFDLASGKALLKKREKNYDFFDESIPIRTVGSDWYNIFHIKEGGSSFNIYKKAGYTSLILVLKDDVEDYRFPTHDFFCLSEDLTLKQKQSC